MLKLVLDQVRVYLRRQLLDEGFLGVEFGVELLDQLETFTDAGFALMFDEDVEGGTHCLNDRAF